MASPATPQLTFRAVLLAVVLAVILSAANAYPGLFAGLTIATAIPAAVVSMGVLRLLGGGSILENNIVQTGASAGSSIAAGVIFTNDRYPRAFDPEGGGLADSGPNEDTLETAVHEGATIGAGAIIGPGLTIGAYAMVGMGAVVTADVPPHGLVVGNPARLRGYVCVCGHPRQTPSSACARCGRAPT